MSVINTNITSMISQSNLNKSKNSLTTAMERLSSGMRINSAKDDAAGQAIANRMTSQVKGLAQAQRNANDGISVAQTAEGALNQINDNLQRIRELTVQSANGTNSTKDLTSIQDEIDQRLEEIDRISTQTNFNGVAVLNTDTPLQIQVGAKDGETISINLQTINRDTLTLNDFSVASTTAVSAAAFAAGASPTTLDVNGTTFTFSSGSATTATATSFAAQPTPVASGMPSGTNTLVQVNGTYYVQNGSGSTATFYEATFSVQTSAVSGTSHAVLNFAAGSQVEGLAVSGFESTATTNPLAKLDAALNKVDNLRSSLGAIQNRFDSAITNLRTNETNLTAARSRIEDADYAVEVANMTRAQILQQAGTSVLAQANQVPQGVLSLLR